MLGGQQGLERIIACHGPALHPGPCFSPFVLSSPSLYLLFFSWNPLLCVLSMMDLMNQVPLCSCTWRHIVCIQSSLPEMYQIHTVVVHRSYFLAFFSCPVLNSLQLLHIFSLPQTCPAAPRVFTHAEEGGRVISHTLQVLVFLPFQHPQKVLLFLQQQDLIADAATHDPSHTTALLPTIATELLASLLHMVISAKFAPACSYIQCGKYFS